MLSPNDYVKYCIRNFGFIVDHSCLCKEERSLKQKFTKIIWEQEFNISYDYPSLNELDYNKFKSRIDFIPNELYHKLKNFHYQVSLNHFKNKTFLAIGLERYKKFLYLKKWHCLNVAPCNSISLIWFAHQLNPLVYYNDTLKILGYTLDQNSFERQNHSLTEDLWIKLFNESYFMPGAMCRGEPANELYFSSHAVEYEKYYSRAGDINLVELALLPKSNENKRSKNPLYKISLMQQNKSLFEEKIKPGQDLSADFGFKYHQNDFSSLDLCLKAEYLEHSSHKVANFIKNGSLHNSKYDKKKQIRIVIPKVIPKSATEIQNFNLNLIDSKKIEYNLMLSLKVTSTVDSSVMFFLKKEPFEEINLNEILNEYKMFDLKEKDLSERKGDAIRAQHVLQVNLNNDKLGLLTVDVLHVVSHQWSSIKIINNGCLIATSHLIGQAELPDIKEVEDLAYSRLAYSKQFTNNLNEFGLDPEYEKSMLIRNVNGDYGILKAKWVEREHDQGHLSIYFYNISNKKSLKFEVENNYVFSIKNEYQVNLSKGHIVIKFLTEPNEIKNLEVESNLALIFSISVLHVLLKPKVKPMLNLSQKKFILPNSSFDWSKNVLLSCVGYPELVRSDGFYNYYSSFCQSKNFESYDNVEQEKSDADTDWLFSDEFSGFETCMDNNGLNNQEEVYSDNEYDSNDYKESKFLYLILSFEIKFLK